MPSVSDLKNDAKPYAQKFALTQDLSLYSQLSLGIRYFDLRPKLQNGNWYLHHSQDNLAEPLPKKGLHEGS
jgi:hypothetical protein